MKKKKKLVISPKILLVILAIFVLGLGAYVYISREPASADLTTEVKKSEGMSLARFQVYPNSNWNAPTTVKFRFAAALYKFYGQAIGDSVSPEQSPKVTGRFFCNKPFVEGYNYPTGLYEPPDAKFEDGAPFPPTDVQDGHNGMKYSWIPGENYTTNAQRFWDMTVPEDYTYTCTYNQPGEYWPLFYADGLSAWYTQKIIISGNGVVFTSTPVPSPSPSVTVTRTASVVSKDLYKAGYTQIGFRGAYQTDVFAKNGMTILNYNSALKSWDRITSGEYLFEANKAYYVYTPTDKYIDKTSTLPSIVSATIVKPGWNFIWADDLAYLSNISLTYKNASNQCIVQNVPLRYLKDDGIVYKWIYNVVDDKALTVCQAFKLLTGKDQNYQGCTESYPLLNETSYAKAKSGVWIYVWPNKVENWSKRARYSCN